MTRRFQLLGGLAILAVVCHHATGWGYTAMFWWTDRYRAVATPNFDQAGTLPYYGLLAIQQLTAFSVPAFLFISGFFVAYVARGSRSALQWNTVLKRIRNLLVPYAIWSVMIFLSDALQGLTRTPVEYLSRLMLGRATSAYYYIPLLCQFYLLSPLVAALAKSRPRLVAAVSALLQLGTLSLGYLVACGMQTPAVTLMMRMTPGWSFPRWAFFFTFGVVSGSHLTQFKQWLTKLKWGLLVALVPLGLLALFEPQAPLQPDAQDWERALASVSSHLYAVVFILCFLAFDRATIPGSRVIYRLNRSSFGIYLLHPTVLEFVARLIRQVMPRLLAHQVILQPLLVALGVGVPLSFMTIVSKSPARRLYRYLFG